MRAVAFLRHVNVGQRGHPSSADLLGAFADAGDPGARAFQSNGTLVFDADDPDGLVADAVVALEARAGVERGGFWMPFDGIQQLVAAHAHTPDASRRELTLHRGAVVDPTRPEVVREARHRRCELLDTGDGWTVARNDRERESNATPVLERLTGGPATSRSIGTLARLVERFAPES